MRAVKSVLVLLVVNCAVLLANGQASKKFFRKDYTYLNTTDSFYKIHTVHRTWEDAKDRCELEGAQLFYALDEEEAKALREFWKNTQPFSWVWVGISDLLVEDVFETVDGRSINDVYSKWGPGEPNNGNSAEDCVILRWDETLNDDNCSHLYPFVCKKSLSELVWNNHCDNADTEYVFNAALGRCYKFHSDPKNWTDAVSICNVEQSYLAIVDSKQEHDYLVDLTRRAPKSEESPWVHLGFRKREKGRWKTNKQILLEKSGYSTWGAGQPDNAGGHEDCGSMGLEGGLNDLTCETPAYFICEHEVGKLAEDIDDRYNLLLSLDQN